MRLSERRDPRAAATATTVAHTPGPGRLGADSDPVDRPAGLVTVVAGPESRPRHGRVTAQVTASCSESARGPWIATQAGSLRQLRPSDFQRACPFNPPPAQVRLLPSCPGRRSTLQGRSGPASGGWSERRARRWAGRRACAWHCLRPGQSTDARSSCARLGLKPRRLQSRTGKSLDDSGPERAQLRPPRRPAAHHARGPPRLIDMFNAGLQREN